MAEVSRRSGVALSNIWKIESGKGAPSFATILAISEALGIPVSYLVADTLKLNRDRFYDAAFHEVRTDTRGSATDSAVRTIADWVAGCTVLVIYALLTAQAEQFATIEYPTEDHRLLLVDALISISYFTPLPDRLGILSNVEEAPVKVIRNVGLLSEAALSKHAAWRDSLPGKDDVSRKWIPKLPRRMETFLSATPNLWVEKDLLAFLAKSKADEDRGTIPPTNTQSREQSVGESISKLTHVSKKVNISGVSSPLESLFLRLMAATKARGKKSELAGHLGVPLARVSQWLSRDRDPGGDTTLRLLQWVTAEEATKKGPTGVRAPIGPEAQFRKSSDEKPKPSPGKKLR